MITFIGGSGFIGTCCLKQQGQQPNLRNIDIRQSESFPQLTVHGDVADVRSLESAIPEESDCIVLLAAEHKDDIFPIEKYYEVNVQGAKNVAEVAAKKRINKIIFTSSVAVYGLNKNNPTEEHPPDPFNHYGKSKLQAEEVLKAWHNDDPTNRTLIIIRPTVVFGPGNKGNVFTLINQILNGKFLMIGDGKNIKSMAFVENVASFINYFTDKKLQGLHLYNYIDKPDLNTNELVEIITTSAQKKMPKTRLPRKIGLIIGYLFDITSNVIGIRFPISMIRIKKFCATTQFSSIHAASSFFDPPYTLKDGLAYTIQDYFQITKD